MPKREGKTPRRPRAVQREPASRQRGRAPRQPDPSPPQNGAFQVVGIGASAGGLEAFTELLKALPLDTGMSFVLIQHLDPQHDSALTQILSRATALPVSEIEHGQPAQRNHVHVIPRGKDLTIDKGVLKIAPRSHARRPHRPIDTFFEHLAQDLQERAIGVVLSGTASDGTLGMEAIKAGGGITFAQDDSAKYESMPRSAIAAGCVDHIMAPAAISRELARIATHPLRAETERAEAVAHENDRTPLPPGEGDAVDGSGARQARAEAAHAPDAAGRGLDGYKKVLMLLRGHSGVDFSLYKSSTIQRRINRRVIITHHDSLAHYAAFLRGNAQELDALYSDVLISVTSFFRNPEVFDVLKKSVLPQLVEQPGHDPLRCWVLGCSTGQEAYSIAMAFTEAVENAPRMRQVQIFATDLNEVLLEKARQGFYVKSLVEEISPQRLRRFFVEEEGGFRIAKSIREMVVFARQNVIVDPPFSRMDLVSCRNLLIYLEPSLQKTAITSFHYALKPTGFLILGVSESIGSFTDLFEPIDRKHKIYARKPTVTSALHLPVGRERGFHARPVNLAEMKREREALAGLKGGLNAQREADRITINQFAPPGVLVNADLQIEQFRGPTGAFLQPPAGKATLDVLKMAREGLMLPLRSALQKAKKTNKTVRTQDVRVKQDGKARAVNLEVIPLKNVSEPGFLILFEDAAQAMRGGAADAHDDNRNAGPLTSKQEIRRVDELDAELAETREYLQAMVEQHEAANEELQSINEELETSKEEIESANEELTTLNEEMNGRNTELSRLNNDLTNLQSSTRLAIVLLGRDLTIRRFSSQAQKQFDLLATDVRRPIVHLRHQLRLAVASDVPPVNTPLLNFADLAAEVIGSVRESEHEVYDDAARRWYQLRIRPYLTLDNKIDGAVLVLVDIDALKRHERLLIEARDIAQGILDTQREPLLLLDEALRVKSANRAFYGLFRTTVAQTVDSSIFELGTGQWDIANLRDLFADVQAKGTSIEDFMVDHDVEGLGRRVMLVNARRLVGAPAADRSRVGVVVAMEDITDRIAAVRTLRANNADLEARAVELIRFNDAAVGRELRMIELKREINNLCRQHGETARYRIAGEAGADENPP